MKLFFSLTSVFLSALLIFSSSLSSQEDGGGGGGGGGFSGDGGFSGSSGNNRGGASGFGVGMVVGENYVLKPSDVVEISVYQEQDLNKQVRVEGDGTVALSLVGKVKVAGMTVGEAQSLITDLYNRDFLVDPQISLLVVSFSPKVITILGSVNRPGVVQIPPDRDLTLTEAIAGANGISRLGNPRSITIKRVDEDGRSRNMDVNFSRIITDPDMRDIILKEGDTIWVPERII